MNRRDFLRYGAIGLGVASTASLVSARPGRALPDSDIVRCAIHPAIGVARVGNSPQEYFIGPEVPNLLPPVTARFKDGAGRVLRQAARFRIYGLDRDGRVVRELTARDARIEWRVHLANTKADWYDFDQAFDIPESADLASKRRNATVGGRQQLRIDPGPRSIFGETVNPAGTDPRFAFDSGEFFGKRVPLGEVRTDDAGRLLVLGGFGQSSNRVAGTPAVTFANNEGWHDDVSDGPVDASVSLDGRDLPVDGAWVVVAPPNYGPGLQGIVTMYDVLFEVAMSLEPDRVPARPSFSRQIYPLFERHVRHEWVNAGFAAQFGWGAPGSFLAPDVLAQLASSRPAQRFVRDSVFRQFRSPSYSFPDSYALPPYYGDGVAIPPTNPRQYMAILPNQYRWLEQWAEGDFDADWNGPIRVPPTVDDLPVHERPAALDRAALDDCLGGPFHPGCELTWPMRIAGLYRAPFRLRRRSGPERDYGPALTQPIVMGPSGPFTGSAPGDLSRWMAVPWQTDTSSCLSAYIKAEGEYLPTFWPARVPNDVLPWAGYQVLMDPAASREAKATAFRSRIKWLRDLPSATESAEVIINRFIASWSDYGIIARQPGPGGDFPDQLWVETGFAAPEGDGTPTTESPFRYLPRN